MISSATTQPEQDSENTAGDEVGPNEYRCECCGQVYEKAVSDEYAMAEADEIWGDALGENPAIVCDDCWRKMMGLPPIAAETEEYNGILNSDGSIPDGAIYAAYSKKLQQG